ncbi:MAG: carbon-nitrogen hydrolase family protein [Sphingobium sp.]|uniref:carbon-nitrogen hydrolase family protein n=1 Tax=Sphingobium sp. TaxID=1912891 RepID=UPI000C5CEDDE|nr:carbon-nitrogen hydrolase family protein [Sphingobium sp.]MBU0775767.1 carbon-nitrogen hydrolase family protein [Alphaproteobacteria bacterium]MBA4753898.1 carbon-nitrogen hydrolase family protein [Sphingobium sp.]MBS88491.1 nitrilase [Sphingobium sp.]MBU0869625.1 carbon-nitrogen hydrolase family protein [Alphaproteobacteria bacterium]TAJ75090.1 MAG: carbon-nitrogen hydrolase family protein [Sphingobium sp.]
MRAALFQMTSGTDPAANAAAIVAMAARARGEGADMLFTPEMAGYLDRDRARAAATLRSQADDAVLAAVREAAAREGLWIHIGSLPLKDERADGRWANRSFLIDDTGAIRAQYDKIHLFDVDLATGESWRESSVYGPGEQVVAADTPWGRMGFSICYDMRFPDLYRALTNAGATILLAPAAFTVPTGQAHWHVLLRARAIEAGCFVIATAQVGAHADGRVTYGHSLVVDPWGDVLLDMGEAGGLGLVDIDLTRLGDVRARVPAIANRRAIPQEVQIS